MTIVKRNAYLKQLGIIQWILRYPLLQSNQSTTIPSTNIRLLLVADQLLPIDHPIILDVIRSIALIPEQLLLLTTKQVIMLPKYSNYHCWWLGVTVQRHFNGISLWTPSLSVLQNNVAAKRDLWRQIIDYQKYFYSNDENISTNKMNRLSDRC